MRKRWVYLALIFILSPFFLISPAAAQSPSAGIDPEIQSRAEAGQAQAEFQVGLEYFNGDNVPRDFAQAAGWFRKAADQGLRQAQFQLGMLCMRGLGVAHVHEEFEGGHRNTQHRWDVSLPLLVKSLPPAQKLR